MNVEPHTHTLTTEKCYMVNRCVQLKYGDSEKHVWLFFPGFSALRIRRAARALIREHDRGSRRAGRQEAALERVRRTTEASGARSWASKGRVFRRRVTR